MSSARFILSAAGIFAINIIASPAAAFEAEPPCPKARFEKLSEKLGLDPYQESALAELMAKHRAEIGARRHGPMEESGGLRARHMEEIAVVLTADQMDQFVEMRPLHPGPPPHL